MHKKWKILPIFLVLVMMLSILPTGGFAAETSVEDVEVTEPVLEPSERETEVVTEFVEEESADLEAEVVEEESTDLETEEILSDEVSDVKDAAAPDEGNMDEVPLDGASEDYRTWAQSDSRWGGLYLGTGGCTVSSAGCLVTSVAKLIIQSGFRNADSFNVATFVNWLNSNTGFTGSNLYWGAAGRMVSGFENYGDILSYGTYSSSGYNNTIINWIKAGYHMTINVNGGGHYVAVDEAKSLETGTVYIMDSLNGVQNADITLGGRYGTFNGIHAWTGGNTPTSTDNTPTAVLDIAEGGTGSIRIRGWAFDKDITSKQVDIHVYSNGTCIYAGLADTYRDDVNAAYGCGNYHGFDVTFKTDLSGNVPITIYVLNYDKNGNYDASKNLTLCSNRNVTVKKSVSINYYGADGKAWKIETATTDQFTLSASYPTKSGSYFCGWSYTSGSSNIDARPGNTITVSADVTLYPVYVTHEKAISGEVVPIYNLADFSASGYTVTAADYKQKTSTTSGYWTDWSGWSTDAVSASSTVQVETTTLYGYYYFKCANCGTHSHGWGSGACYTWIGGCGSYISSDSAATMYSTVNWNTTQDWHGTGKYYTTINGERWFRWDDGGTRTGYRYKTYVETTDEKETTLSGCIITAVKTYTVTYDANGGTGAPSSQTKTHDVTLTLSSTKPTRTGYAFQGWATSKTAASASYSAGGSYTNNAAVTLYAVWKANTYTITYDANGGTGAPSSQTKTHDAALTLSSTQPTRDGYTFKGWATSKTAASAGYSAGGSYTNNADMTLYAVWEENIPVTAAAIVTAGKTAVVGSTVTVTVSIQNNPGMSCLTVTPVYDTAVFTLESVQNGTVFPNAPQLSTNYLWDCDDDVTADGVLFTYTFRVKEAVPAGSYTVGVKFRECRNVQEESLTLSVSNGTVKVIDFVYGDATGEGSVNGADLVRLRKYLAGYNYDTKTSTEAVSPGADASGDGEINGADLVRLRKYLAAYDYDSGTSSVKLGPTT